MFGKEVSYATFIGGVISHWMGPTKGLVAVLTDLKAFEMFIFFALCPLVKQEKVGRRRQIFKKPYCDARHGDLQ